MTGPIRYRSLAMTELLLDEAITPQVGFGRRKVSNLVLRPEPTPDEIHFTRADDGWRLALFRYRRDDAAAHHEPVLLHHGLGANHTLFDLGVEDGLLPVPSLAHWLADRGYDVWVCDLRGAGWSERPDRGAPHRWDWSMDDFIHRDDPAFLAYLLEHSDHERVHWIGHSMGGVLALAHCCLHGSPRLASSTVVAAGLDWSGTASSYQLIVPLRHIGRKVGHIRSGQISKLFSPLVGRWRNGVEMVNSYPGSTAPAASRAMYRGTTQDVSGEVLYQLASLFEPGGLRSLDRSLRYTDLVDRITTPTMLLSGDRDLQCPAVIPARTLRSLPGDGHLYAPFGRHHGHEGHYGHFDLINGIHAEREVFPRILHWLQAHPA